MKCIYCKNEITPAQKSIEHVFPQAFGCPDTWVLDCVCRKCNNDFGGKLERYLASDSMEGLWRLQKIGSKSKKSIKQTRIKINLPDEEKYGEFRGIILYVDFTGTDQLYPPPQVLTDLNGKRTFTLIESMTDEDIRNINDRFEIFAKSEDERQLIVKRFEGLGKKMDIGGHALPETAVNPDGKIEIEFGGVIDAVIFRTIAKIAFNYLAKAKGADYALNDRFDGIRNYILNGGSPSSQFVRIEKGHILTEETDKKYLLDGHIFTIESRGNQIISRISLTNMFNFFYVVRLGDMGLIWHDINTGHAYSFSENEMIPLFSPTFLTIAGRIKKLFKR